MAMVIALVMTMKIMTVVVMTMAFKAMVIALIMTITNKTLEVGM
jgi:hypothetical protein